MDTKALSLAITKGLAYTENGGAPSANKTKAGKSGELKSIFQFLPATWKEYSKEITGQDNLPLTAANEAEVVNGKVSKWVDEFSKEGKNPTQIATAVGSLWNSGNADPNVAGSGTNKEGVKFNAPAYAKKVATYANQFLPAAIQHLKTNPGLIASTTPATVSTPMMGMLPQQNSPQPQLGLPTAPGALNA